MKYTTVKDEIEITRYEIDWLKKFGRKSSSTYFKTLWQLESKLELLFEKLIALQN